jgi:hypothetical protein
METRHYIVKEINNVKTLWAANWHKTQTFSYNELPNVVTFGDFIAIIGDVLWFTAGNSNSNVYVALPFRLSVPDGASLRYVTHEGQHQYASYNLYVRLLRFDQDREEWLETSGLYSEGGQGLNLYWNRRQCMWTYENT